MKALTAISSIILLAGFAAGRVGVGPCPTTYPTVNSLFSSSSIVPDGRAYMSLVDSLTLWGMNTFGGGIKTDCFAAKIEKITTAYNWSWRSGDWSTGFKWTPYQKFPDTSCKEKMHCDDGKATCSCYVNARPWEVVFYDTETATMAGYQCSDMKTAIDTAYKNLGSPAFLKQIMDWFASVINNYHYSFLFVATGTLNPTSAQKTRINNFINTFPDQQPNYRPSLLTSAIASGFGFNGKPTYSVGDLTVINQSETTCKWSTTA